MSAQERQELESAALWAKDRYGWAVTVGDASVEIGFDKPGYLSRQFMPLAFMIFAASHGWQAGEQTHRGGQP